MQTSRRSFLLGLSSLSLPFRVPARTLVAPPDPGMPDVLLARPYLESIDPAGYLVSEKYDGVRGLWDGRTLRFRSGRPVPAPAWFTARLPAEALDGELWLGRGRFEAASGIVRRETPVDAEWQRMHFMVFELPGAPGPFSARAAQIPAIVREAAFAPLVAVEQTPVADRAELRRRLESTIARGGEGLALHLASAPVTSGRSDVLLKLKPSLDAEATVVAYRAGKGKYDGMLGALLAQAPDGRRFLIGSGLSDALRREPPPLGSVVTYRYRDLTGSGLPRFATFLRVHHEA